MNSIHEFTLLEFMNSLMSNFFSNTEFISFEKTHFLSPHTYIPSIPALHQGVEVQFFELTIHLLNKCKGQVKYVEHMRTINSINSGNCP